MQPIVSGTTTERIVRTALLLLLFGGLSVWSFLDGYIDYPRENVVKALEGKGIEVPKPPPAVHKEITAERYEVVFPRESSDRPAVRGRDRGAESLGKLLQRLDVQSPATLSTIVDRIGVQPFRYDDKAMFFGPGGFLQFTVAVDHVTSCGWTAGPEYTETDLFVQKCQAFGLAPVGLVLLFQLVRVLRTRVTLNDEGLTLRGKATVPFDAMTGFSADMYDRKGWLELDYSLYGQKRALRLDNYVIQEFRPIIEAICERTGLENPLPPPEDDLEEEEALPADIAPTDTEGEERK
jgi:hypothetical protein